MIDYTDPIVNKKPATGFKMLQTQPLCTVEFWYGFLEGSNLIGNSQNMTICKNTVSQDMIAKGMRVASLLEKDNINNTFDALYESYGMLYNSNRLAVSCTGMLSASYL